MDGPDIYASFARSLLPESVADSAAGQQALITLQQSYGKMRAGRALASGDTSGAANALLGEGLIPDGQALQDRTSRQSMLGAASTGDVAGARNFAAQTGDPKTFGEGQAEAQSAAAQKVLGLRTIAARLGQIQPQPGEPPDAVIGRRAAALNGDLNSGAYNQFGLSPDLIRKAFASNPSDLADGHLSYAASPYPYSGVLKKDETAMDAGHVVGQGYHDPITLHSGPGSSEAAYSATGAPGGPPIAATTPTPQIAAPGSQPLGPDGKPVPGSAPVPQPLNVTPNSKTGGVNITNPNLPPSPSPASVAMTPINGNGGHAGPGGGTLGDRSNNPGNIQPSPDGTWQGQVGVNSRGYSVFDTPENGARALDLNLAAYAKHGITTPEALVERWASTSPPNEKAAYAARIRAAAGGNFNLADPAVRAAIEPAIAQSEGTHLPTGAPRGPTGAPVPGGALGPGQSISVGGASVSPATQYGLKGERQPDGSFTPTSGANVDFTGATGAKEKIYNNDEVKMAMSSQAAYQALTANAGKLTGPAAYNILDTWIRTINPGRAATVGAIQAAAEQLGITTQVLGHWLSAQQKGGLPLNVQQQIIDGVLPFAQGHYDQAANVVKGYTEAARQYGGDDAAKAVNVDLGRRASRFVIGTRGPNNAGGSPPGDAASALIDARAALAAGADRGKVLSRLRGWGIDPGRL